MSSDCVHFCYVTELPNPSPVTPYLLLVCPLQALYDFMQNAWENLALYQDTSQHICYLLLPVWWHLSWYGMWKESADNWCWRWRVNTPFSNLWPLRVTRIYFFLTISPLNHSLGSWEKKIITKLISLWLLNKFSLSVP